MDDARIERLEAVDMDGKNEEVVDEKVHNMVEVVLLVVVGTVDKVLLDVDGAVVEDEEVDKVEVAPGVWAARCVDVDTHGDGVAQKTWIAL